MDDFEMLIVGKKPRSFEEFYNDEEKDQNNFNYWYPKVSGLFRTPKTYIKQVPVDIAQILTEYNEPAARQQYPDYRERLQKFCTEVCQEAVDLLGSNRVFLKNARFSNKFDFNNSCSLILSPDELERHLAYITYQSMCMDALGFTQLVIRELLDFDSSRIPTIYNGMPLRPEYRAFYDFDQKKLLYIHDYWDYQYVRKGLYSASDKIVFKKGWKQRYRTWSKHLKDIQNECQKLAAVNGMTGVWSVDFLLHNKASSGKPLGDKAGIYLIDMALAQQSTYWSPEEAGLSIPEV